MSFSEPNEATIIPHGMSEDEVEQLLDYMMSDAFRRRASCAEARILAGETLTFDQIAVALQLPLHVLIGGFMCAMAKRGVLLRPVGRVN